MIVLPTQIHEDFNRAKLGFVSAAEQLDLVFNCHLMTMWKVDINPSDSQVFIDLAKEEANQCA